MDTRSWVTELHRQLGQAAVDSLHAYLTSREDVLHAQIPRAVDMPALARLQGGLQELSTLRTVIANTLAVHPTAQASHKD